MIVGGLFTSDQQLNPALEALQEQGFLEYTVFGPDELFKEPAVSPEVEERLESQQHTAAGTASGVTHTPRSAGMRDADARPLEDELREFGLGQEEIDFYVAALQQEQTLLLVSTPRGRAGEARGILQAEGAVIAE